MLKYNRALVLSQDGHHLFVFYLRQVYKNDLDILIKLRPNPGLV